MRSTHRFWIRAATAVALAWPVSASAQRVELGPLVAGYAPIGTFDEPDYCVEAR